MLFRSQFAQSMGSLEKTDRIDAGMIAWYAEVKKSPGAPSLRFFYARVGGHRPVTGESVSPFYLLHKITTAWRTLFI